MTFRVLPGLRVWRAATRLTYAGLAAAVAGLAEVVGGVAVVVRRAGVQAAALAPQVEETGGAAQALPVPSALTLAAGRVTPMARPGRCVAIVTGNG